MSSSSTLSPLESELCHLLAKTTRHNNNNIFDWSLIEQLASPALKTWIEEKKHLKTFSHDPINCLIFWTRRKLFRATLNTLQQQQQQQDNEDDEEAEEPINQAQGQDQPAEIIPDVDPLDLSDTERELAQVLVSTPKMGNGEYDWNAIADNASDELRTKIAMKRTYKTFLRAPTDTLVKYTRRKLFRQYLLGLTGVHDEDVQQQDDDEELEEESTSAVPSHEDDVDEELLDLPETDTLSEPLDDNFSDLTDLDQLLAKLMANTPRLNNGRYDWKSIYSQAPKQVQELIDAKSTYVKFYNQPIDYLVSQSRRKIFRNYLVFLVGSLEGCKTVVKIKPTEELIVPTATKGKRSKSRTQTSVGLKQPPDEKLILPDTKKRKRYPSVDAGVLAKKVPSSEGDPTPKKNVLGPLERELAELLENTPKLTEKGRASHDWDEIERRATSRLKRRFSAKRHMTSYQKWPLHVMVADPLKSAFRYYREQLRNKSKKNLNQVEEELEEHEAAEAVHEEEGESVIEQDDSLARIYATRKVLEFRPRMTVVNEQYKILTYTATEANGFLKKMREIRKERLNDFLVESNLDGTLAEHIQAFQREDHELVQEVLKDFLMASQP